MIRDTILFHLSESRDKTERAFTTQTDREIGDFSGGLLSVVPGLLDPEDIGWVQYSAIHDARTCNYCKKLDGTILSVRNDIYLSGKYDPPVHNNCRCGWVQISRREEGIKESEALPFQDYEDNYYQFTEVIRRKFLKFSLNI